MYFSILDDLPRLRQKLPKRLFKRARQSLRNPPMPLRPIRRHGPHQPAIIANHANPQRALPRLRRARRPPEHAVPIHVNRVRGARHVREHGVKTRERALDERGRRGGKEDGRAVEHLEPREGEARPEGRLQRAHLVVRGVDERGGGHGGCGAEVGDHACGLVAHRRVRRRAQRDGDEQRDPANDSRCQDRECARSEGRVLRIDRLARPRAILPDRLRRHRAHHIVQRHPPLRTCKRLLYDFDIHQLQRLAERKLLLGRARPVVPQRMALERQEAVRRARGCEACVERADHREEDVEHPEEGGHEQAGDVRVEGAQVGFERVDGEVGQLCARAGFERGLLGSGGRELLVDASPRGGRGELGEDKALAVRERCSALLVAFNRDDSENSP